MNQQNIDALYYSKSNLDNTFSQVVEEIRRRTNKDISKNSSYRNSFEKMANIVYDKIPQTDRNMAKCNTVLIEKSVNFFHSKIFEKTMHINNPPATNINQNQQLSSQSNMGFSTMNDNTDLEKRMTDLMASRQTLGAGAGIRGDGKPMSYTPQPVLMPNQVIQPPITSTNAAAFQKIGDNVPVQNKLSLINQNIDFKIKPFSLTDDLTESLIGSDIQDSPLYQNIEHLQRMDGVNPMSVLEDYTRKRNEQAQRYIDTERRENITAMITNANPIEPRNIIQERNNTNAITKIDQTATDPMELLKQGTILSNKYVERMEERIVNDNTYNTIYPDELIENQEKMVKFQRDTQPKYIEKVHYININSVDRDWADNKTESRYNFQVKFNQNAGYSGTATINQMYRNIISVELVSAVMPMDAFIEPFDTRIYMGLSRYPYLLLRIDELDNVFKGTNNWVDKAFSTMIFDKVFYTNTLSTDYISGVGTSIVQSTPKQGFSGEYLRGFMKYNPAYFEKKKYYNNPLANLSRMTIGITDPRGNTVNTQKDVLDILQIQYTGNIAAITGTELVPTYAWPFSTQGSYSMLKITTSTYFSNRLFRIGDRVIIKNFTFDIGHTGSNDNRFETFINRDEGHIIINLDVETNGATNTNNRGYINNFYIPPAGLMNSTNQTVDPTTYYDNTGSITVDFSNVKNWGRVIDVDLQTQLLFRIVSRDPDTSSTMQPINVY